jgi:heat shock protein HslJ
VITVQSLQANFLHELDRGRTGDIPDMFLIDIQTDQRQGVSDMISQTMGKPPLLVPTVRTRIVAVNGKATPIQADYFVQFTDKALGAKFGCNSMSGDYKINGDHLTVGNLIATQMACPDPSMSFERDAGVFLRGNIRVEKVGGDRLRLVNEAGSIELKRSV